MQTFTERREILVTGMDCADCARTLERGVGTLPEVENCEVNFASERLSVSFDPSRVDERAIANRVRSLGYGVGDEAADHSHGLAAEATQRGAIGNFLSFMRERGNAWLWTASILLLVSLVMIAVGLDSTLVGTAAVVVGGFPIARRGIRSLLFSRRVTIDLLVAIAGVGAIILGETVEGAVLVVLFALGEALEGYAINRSRAAMRSLQQLAPAEATVLEPCEEGDDHQDERKMPVSEVAVGAIVMVAPGDRIPLDGIIRRGLSGINQQAITGESIPVERGVSEQVFAGSVNGDGALEVEVTAPASSSMLSRIASLVEQAFNNRAPIERVIDRFAAIYTPIVILIAIAVAAIPPLVFGQPFWDTPAGEHGWFYRALTLLVVACPCALVISTPATVVSALASAARSGALIRGGAALESLAGIRAVAFDKTGTLTTGAPHVTRVHCADACCDGALNCEHCNEILNLAAAVEKRSTHPLAGAVVAAADARIASGRYTAADDARSLPGRGVQGTVDGRTVTVGSHVYFDADHTHETDLCDWVEDAERQGQTVMLVCDCATHDVRGYIAVADSPRTISAEAISSLRREGVERIVILTGDNPAAGEAIGKAVGVDEVRASLLPADKLAAIAELRSRYGGVAMVGDGINDTPALAAATVGVAMGAAGSAQALQTADVALMGDDLRRLPFILSISRQAQTIIRQNIAFSLISKLLFLVLVLIGFSSLWLAVLADVGASLLVTLNGLRLLRARPSTDDIPNA